MLLWGRIGDREWLDSWTGLGMLRQDAKGFEGDAGGDGI